jgi:murein DD-endopeptidase MepM/ murein hydrolase activator NlpD
MTVPTRFLRCIVRLTLPAAITILLLASSGAWADVDARPSPIEVVCAKPPMAVPADGTLVLSYELHVTNFGTAPLTFRSVEISGGGKAAPLATIDGSTLAQSLQLVGPGDDPTRLEPGRRAILFVWLSLPPVGATSAIVPATLRHRFTFAVGDKSTASGANLQLSVLDGVAVPTGVSTNGAQAPGPPVLEPPFRGGIWLAGNGPSNTSAHRRSVIALEGRARISQRFAIDWLLIGANGDTSHDDVTKLENWWGYGEPILAAADGEVTRVVDAYPDNPPRTTPPPVTVDNIAGNHVIIRFASNRYVMCAHLKHGSVRVKEGQRVKKGEQIAELGNSGNTTGPHVHFEVMDANSAIAAEGEPWIFPSFHFLGFGKDYDPDHHPDVLHLNEIPVDDMVVSMPVAAHQLPPR